MRAEDRAETNSVTKLGGISFQKEHCFDIALTAVYVSQQFWQDANIGSPAIPKAIFLPTVFSALRGLAHHEKFAFELGAISNLTDANYYNRVFANGIEPAPRISGCAGASLEF